MNIGDKIRQARIAKGLTQEELGKLLGLQKSAVAKYENGRVVNIKRTTLKKISDVLGIRPAELIFEKIEKNDAIADIVVRLRTDEKFLSVVELLYNLDENKIDGVEQMLNAFKK